MIDDLTDTEIVWLIDWAIYSQKSPQESIAVLEYALLHPHEALKAFRAYVEGLKNPDAKFLGMIDWLLDAQPQDQEAALMLAMSDPNNEIQAHRWIVSRGIH
jgi:hypothetical protein